MREIVAQVPEQREPRRWVGTVDLEADLTAHRPPEVKEGDRILVHSLDGDYTMVIDEVTDPDSDGVKRATAHIETANDRERA